MSLRICALALLFAFLGAIASTSVISFWPYKLGLLPDVVTEGIRQWDVLSFGGILVTLMSLVSAFYILLLAIDAFALSKTISSNQDRIDKNDISISNLSARGEELENTLSELNRKTSVFSDELVLVEHFLNEMNSANNENERIFTILGLDSADAKNREAIDKLVLDGRTKFRQRRARVNALISLISSELSDLELEALQASIPELLEMAKLGDERSSKILVALKSSDMLGLSDADIEASGLNSEFFTVVN